MSKSDLAVVKPIAQPVECVVEAFEKHLEAAKRGEYVAFALVTVYPDGSTGTQHCGVYDNAVRGALAFLIHRINTHSDAPP